MAVAAGRDVALGRDMKCRSSEVAEAESESSHVLRSIGLRRNLSAAPGLLKHSGQNVDSRIVEAIIYSNNDIYMKCR